MESLHTYLSEPRTPPDKWHLLNKLPNPQPPYREPPAPAQCGTQLPPIAHVPRLSLRARVPPQCLPDSQVQALGQEATLWADGGIGDARFAGQPRGSVQLSTVSSDKKRIPQIYEQSALSTSSSNHNRISHIYEQSELSSNSSNETRISHIYEQSALSSNSSNETRIPQIYEQSALSFNSSNNHRISHIYEQSPGPSANHDYMYPQQNVSRAQPVVVPIMAQPSGAIVRRQSTYTYANNLTTSVQREEVVRVEESLEFVTFNGPPVKNDPASRSRIKAHVMRQIHQQKRMEKMVKSQARTIPTQPLHTCACNEATSFNADSSAQQLPPRTRSLSTKAVDSSHVITTPDAGNNLWPSGFSVVVSCQECGNIEIFRCHTEEALTYRPYTASPRDLLPGQSVLNPFTHFSVTVTHFMHEMIHHFLYEHLPKTNPDIYGKGNLFSPAIYLVDLSVTDPAAVYAMVAQGAYHRSVLINRADNKEEHKNAVMQATVFLSEAMRLLQEKFDDAKSALSNVSIFITAMLASSMGIVGDRDQLEAHCRGMTRMVELRGGIDTLPRIIAHQVSRIDSNSAWVFKTQPKCPMYKSRFRERSSHPLIFGSVGSTNPFPDTRLQDFCAKPLFNIACDLKHLTNLLNLHDREPRKIGLKEREYFEDNFAGCQHGLASFPHLHTILVRSTMDYRQECLRLALFIYFNTGIRVSPSPRFLKSMTSPLVEAFQESDLSSLWHPVPSVLLWVLFMGYCGSYDPFDKGWFVQESRRVVSALKLGSCDEMETLLAAFLYRKCLHWQPLRELWQILAT